MLGMVRDAQAFAEQAGDAAGGPQLVGPAVRLGALEQELFQKAELVVGKAWGVARVGTGLQAVRLPGQPPPAVDGRRQDAQDARDGGGRFTLFHQFNRPSATAFEFSRCSFGSHASLYARRVAWNGFTDAGLSKLAAAAKHII